jgi:hypothetical protein
LNLRPAPLKGLIQLDITDDEKLILEMEDGIKKQHLFGKRLIFFLENLPYY